MNLVESDIDTKRLRDIKLADKPRIDFLLSLAPNRGCENCFANLFMWGEVYGLEILEIGERRAVVYNGRDKYLYFPLGGLPSPGRARGNMLRFRAGGARRAALAGLQCPARLPANLPLRPRALRLRRKSGRGRLPLRRRKADRPLGPEAAQKAQPHKALPRPKSADARGAALPRATSRRL